LRWHVLDPEDAEKCWYTRKYQGKNNIVFEDSDGNIKLSFTGCSKITVTTNPEDRINPIRERTISQIPYFIQDIEVEDILVNGYDLLSCKILMPPMNIELKCNLINIGEAK